MLAALAPLLSSHALFFFRTKGRVADTLNGLGGTRVYSTPAEVNGSPGTLSAYAFTGRDAHEVSAVLTKQLKLPPAPRGSGALLTYKDNDRVQRLIVLPSGQGSGDCIALVFDQSLRDAQRNADAPPAWPDGFPPLPGTPRFTAVCANTRTAFASADAHGAPEDAAQEAAAALQAAGWHETPASTPAFRLFSDRNRLCAVFASRDPKTGQTTLSVVQRNGAGGN
ncbi:MAG: hypothetical protein FWG50_07425 [Kiritimatiellaeota bacterium]|nr:hypothetical protein [Kiritimatiellota bacterium]